MTIKKLKRRKKITCWESPIDEIGKKYYKKSIMSGQMRGQLPTRSLFLRRNRNPYKMWLHCADSLQKMISTQARDIHWVLDPDFFLGDKTQNHDSRKLPKTSSPH